MTPADYLRIVVLPTLAEMLAEPADQRRAYLACITAAHLVDHIAVTLERRPDGKPDIRAVRSTIAANGPDGALALEIVEAVCNGTKHAGPDPEPNSSVKLSSGEERLVSAFSWGVEGAGWGQARWNAPGLVVDHGGAHHFLDGCVRATIRACAAAFPDRFAGIDLAPVARHLDRYAKLDAAELPPTWTTRPASRGATRRSGRRRRWRSAAASRASLPTSSPTTS